jgi:phosphopantetheinyl transferase
VKRAVVAHISLSRAEWQQFRSLRGPAGRKTEWLFGRVAAKDAVRALWYERHGERLYPADMEIQPDPHGRPIARRLLPSPSSAGKEDELPSVSISHAVGVMAALATFGRSCGLDLEPVRPRGEGFETIAFDADERRLLDRFGPARDEGIARLWCAREAISKALGRGQVEGPRSLAVRDFDLATGDAHVTLGQMLATEFPELRGKTLLAHTVRDGDLVVATSFCERIALPKPSVGC